MHGYGYVEGKCGVMIPLTAGLTQETMAAALRDWEVITCGLDLNHQAVGHPAEATLLLMQVALQELGVSVLGSSPIPFHTARCNIGKLNIAQKIKCHPSVLKRKLDTDNGYWFSLYLIFMFP